MKRILLTLAAAGMALLASCGGDTVVCPDCPEIPEVPETPELPETVASTYWAAESAWGDSHELTVTATEATYTVKEHGGYRWVGRGKYTYEKPTLTLPVYDLSELVPVTIIGTVEDEETMSVEVSGIVRAAAGAITLKKQEPKQAVSPAEPTLVGNWRLTKQTQIKDGVRTERETDGTAVYTFRANRSGWRYLDNNIQESFVWHYIDKDNIHVSGQRWEGSDDIAIDPGDYVEDEGWSILQLTTDKLALSFLMIPIEGFAEEGAKPYTMELGLEREL